MVKALPFQLDEEQSLEYFVCRLMPVLRYLTQTSRLPYPVDLKSVRILAVALLFLA